MATSEPITLDLANLEVLSALRRLERQADVSAARAALAVDAYRLMPIRRLPTFGLLDEVWTLRHNVSAYDAAYVALARVLSCDLVTADARLAGVPSLGIRVVVA